MCEQRGRVEEERQERRRRGRVDVGVERVEGRVRGEGERDEREDEVTLLVWMRGSSAGVRQKGG